MAECQCDLQAFSHCLAIAFRNRPVEKSAPFAAIHQVVMQLDFAAINTCFDQVQNASQRIFASAETYDVSVITQYIDDGNGCYLVSVVSG